MIVDNTKRKKSFWRRWFAGPRFYYGFMIAIFLGWGVGFVFSYSSQDSWRGAFHEFCLLWLTSGAAFFTGTFTGFIFGFPKTNQILSNTVIVSRYNDNTNLEEVSDWLTKIIVGISLVQFPRIFQFVKDIGYNVEASIDGQNIKADSSIHIVVIASIIYGFVCGFLYYYIWARLRFYRALKKHQNNAFHAPDIEVFKVAPKTPDVAAAPGATPLSR